MSWRGQRASARRAGMGTASTGRNADTHDHEERHDAHTGTVRKTEAKHAAEGSKSARFRSMMLSTALYVALAATPCSSAPTTARGVAVSSLLVYPARLRLAPYMRTARRTA